MNITTTTCTDTPLWQPWDDQERAALVALLRRRPTNLTWAQIATKVSELNSALGLWKETVDTHLFSGEEDVALTEAADDIRAWRDDNLGFLTFMDSEFPQQLREIQEMPPVLFHQGVLRVDDVGISVVGSRNASSQGREIAATIAMNLVQREITVISGLAKGIDAAAHRAALDAGGRTVACIGTGITKHYPAENRSLQDEIAASGLVLSQFWPDAPPRAANFPMRNAVMSGYGRATIVVEAGEKSGARIQARQAVQHGRPVILTDMVVEANDWARKLVNQPGVYVASSTRAIMNIVEQLVSEDVPVDHILRQLLGDERRSRFME